MPFYKLLSNDQLVAGINAGLAGASNAYNNNAVTSAEKGANLNANKFASSADNNINLGHDSLVDTKTSNILDKIKADDVLNPSIVLNIASQMPDYSNVIKDALGFASNNSAFNQASADKQMDFQREMVQLANSNSAYQAQLNREFQERMSNTSHQREVQDLIKAGLNPVLSALNGASTPTGSAGAAFNASGSSATADNSVGNVFGQILTSAASVANMNAQVQASMANTAMNNATSKDVANIYTKATERGQNINSVTNLIGNLISVVKSAVGAKTFQYIF